MKNLFALWCVCLAGVLCAEIPSAPTGREWEDCQNLSLGKLPPRAWFGSFPSVEEAKAPQPLPRGRIAPGETLSLDVLMGPDGPLVSRRWCNGPRNEKVEP